MAHTAWIFFLMSVLCFIRCQGTTQTTLTTTTATTVMTTSAATCLGRSNDTCSGSCIWRTHCVNLNDSCELIMNQGDCLAATGCDWTYDGVCDTLKHPCMSLSVDECTTDPTCKVFDGCISPRNTSVCDVPCATPRTQCQSDPWCAVAYDCANYQSQVCGASPECIFPCLSKPTVSPSANSVLYFNMTIGCYVGCVQGLNQTTTKSPTSSSTLTTTSSSASLSSSVSTSGPTSISSTPTSQTSTTFSTTTKTTTTKTTTTKTTTTKTTTTRTTTTTTTTLAMFNCKFSLPIDFQTIDVNTFKDALQTDLRSRLDDPSLIVKRVYQGSVIVDLTTTETAATSLKTQVQSGLNVQYQDKNGDVQSTTADASSYSGTPASTGSTSGSSDSDNVGLIVGMTILAIVILIIVVAILYMAHSTKGKARYRPHKDSPQKDNLAAFQNPAFKPVGESQNLDSDA